MTIGDWHKKACKTLKKAKISSEDLDCWLMLENVLNKTRSQLMAHPETKLSTEEAQHLNSMIEDRERHRPMAYILGQVEFYGETFNIDERVLVPRPETETMLEMLKELDPLNLIDVGTGSGAIAIHAKKLFPSKRVTAIDNDSACLDVTRKNAKLHDVFIYLRNSNLVDGISIPKGTVVLANLPYVPEDFGINKAAMTEPHNAIYGGKDGLDLYRKMFEQLKGKAVIVLTESMPPQHKKLTQIAKKNGFKQTKESDFIQQFELA